MNYYFYNLLLASVALSSLSAHSCSHDTKKIIRENGSHQTLSHIAQLNKDTQIIILESKNWDEVEDKLSHADADQKKIIKQIKDHCLSFSIVQETVLNHHIHAHPLSITLKEHIRSGNSWDDVKQWAYDKEIQLVGWFQRILPNFHNFRTRITRDYIYETRLSAEGKTAFVRAENWNEAGQFTQGTDRQLVKNLAEFLPEQQDFDAFKKAIIHGREEVFLKEKLSNKDGDAAPKN